MSIKNLAKTWSLPDRTNDRQQLTLRISYDLYAKLHALKEVYNQRPVNDMISDILKAGLDEIIDALPSYKIDAHEAVEHAHFFGGNPDDYANSLTGPRIKFDSEYRRILELKSDSESEQGEAA
jgi:hypothetical protein